MTLNAYVTNENNFRDGSTNDYTSQLSVLSTLIGPFGKAASYHIANLFRAHC